VKCFWDWAIPFAGHISFGVLLLVRLFLHTHPEVIVWATILFKLFVQALNRFRPFAHEVRAKLASSQAHDCNIDSDDIQHIWCLGSEVNESPKVVLERFLVFLLTREKITLRKLWTLETLKNGEDLLLQVIPSVNHTRTQERIPLSCDFVCSNDE
jgi:hypothetical protein